jgi:COP9 signalosome complex subunit 12
MDTIINHFKSAQARGDGYGLAATITPVAPANDTGRPYAFYKSSNSFDIQSSIRAAIVFDNDLQLDRTEANAWVDVFVAYWKAVGVILGAEEATRSGKFRGGEWAKAYDAWKEVANTLIKGHTTATFPAWTIPCLYIAAKYMRYFAIKADEQAAKEQGNITFSSELADDIVASTAKNQKLEDAARQLMRIFSLCTQDR